MVSARHSLREELEKRSTQTDGLGIPVTLERSKKVISLDTYTATVTLDDGTTVSSDSVLGGDDTIVSLPAIMVMSSVSVLTEPLDGSMAFR
jgi:hypothetical protein